MIEDAGTLIGGGLLCLALLSFLMRHSRVEPVDNMTDAQRVDLMERECRIGPYADLPDADVEHIEHMADVIEQRHTTSA